MKTIPSHNQRFAGRVSQVFVLLVSFVLSSSVHAQHANSERQRELVRQAAGHMARFKIAKFEGIYNAYAE